MQSLDQIRNIKSTEELNRALEERASELMKRCDWEHLSKIEWADIKTQDEWNTAKQNSLKDYFTGKFLIDSIGGAKNSRPSLVAVLLQLRLGWIEEYELTTIPELIVLDFALLSYYQFLKINDTIGNLEWAANFEFFDGENPKLNYDKHYKAKEFASEEHIEKMTASLLPTLDRFNKIFLRNLKALRDLKRSNAVLNIGNVNQINIGEKQINVVHSAVMNK
jgi:hypothetical protein